MHTQTDHDTSQAVPTADRRAALVLRAAATMLLPLARWLVRHGVPYGSLTAALKPVFVEAARRELLATGARVTDSALSVLSGVHRRDIRELDQRDADAARPKTPSTASQVFTRWLTDARFRDAKDRPVALHRTGPEPSFDALAREVSSDVHPRTLLAEMQRVGLVEVDGETVRVRADAFVPQQDFDERVALFAGNVADHVAAAAHNMSDDERRFIEQSVFGSGLTPGSTEALAGVARQLWAQAFEAMAREATQRYEHDQNRPDAQMRMRFGVYYYAEPDPSLNDSAPSTPR